MKENKSNEGRFSLKGKGLGTVTEAMVRKRAGELALVNGRSRHEILDSDLEQARRELTGEETLVPERTPAESLPEESREAVPESTAHRAPTIRPPDEQEFAEELVDEGVEDAEQDQMVRATEESLKREKR